MPVFEIEQNVQEPKGALKKAKYADMYAAVFDTAPDKWHRAKMEDKKYAQRFSNALRGYARRQEKRIQYRIIHESESDTFYLYWNWNKTGIDEPL